jgi:hypothetical protein
LKRKRKFERKLAVGSWQLAVGSWQLAVGSWQLAVGSNFKKLHKSSQAVFISTDGVYAENSLERFQCVFN